MRRAWSSLSLRAQNIASDDHPVYLRWTVVDAEGTRFAVEVLERRVGGDSQSAADLDGPVDDAVHRLRHEHLADRRLVPDIVAALVLPCRLHHHQARRV